MQHTLNQAISHNETHNGIGRIHETETICTHHYQDDPWHSESSVHWNYLYAETD